MTELDLSDIDSKEEYIERTRERRRKIRKLLLHEDGTLVTEDELFERLEEQYGIVVEERNGEQHFIDKEFERRREDISEGETIESVVSRENVPVTKAYTMVLGRKHPDDLLPVEKVAKRQQLFDEKVNNEFERQLEEQDDPFPLEY